MYFNIVGNPVDGFRLIGPFQDFESAAEWQEGCDESCWVIESASAGLDFGNYSAEQQEKSK